MSFDWSFRMLGIALLNEKHLENQLKNVREWLLGEKWSKENVKKTVNMLINVNNLKNIYKFANHKKNLQHNRVISLVYFYPPNYK